MNRAAAFIDSVMSVYILRGGPFWSSDWQPEVSKIFKASVHKAGANVSY